MYSESANCIALSTFVVVVVDTYSIVCSESVRLYVQLNFIWMV